MHITSQKAINFVEHWVGDPIYPFMLTGFELLGLVTPSTPFATKLDMWNMAMGFMALGVSLQFPITSVLRNDDVTGVRMNTLDPELTARNGYATPRNEDREMELYAKSDLVNSARWIASTRVFTYIKDNNRTINLTHASRYYTEVETQYQAFYSYYDVFNVFYKTMKKELGEDAEFIRYLEGEPMYESEEARLADEYGEYEKTISFGIGSMFMSEKYTTHWYNEHMKYMVDINRRVITNNEFFSKLLLNIYTVIGHKLINLKPIDNQRLMWQYVSEYEGTPVLGVISQADTYIPLDSSLNLWGILVPHNNKKTGETVYKAVHLFAE
jgi:hypothetical protein